MAAPEYPQLPSFNRLRVFLIGLLWAVLGAALPAAAIIYDDIQQNEPTNYPKLIRTSELNMLAAVLAYWRKHEAWLRTPPE